MKKVLRENLTLDLDAVPELGRAFGLYVHIPFCLSKCPYCDFNSFAGMEWLVPRYTAAVGREVFRWSKLLSKPTNRLGVGSVYFGGGTPTMLGSPNLAQLLAAIRDRLDLCVQAEVTAETNPGVSDVTDIVLLREAGFNRLSMGIQSFDDDELRCLGRIHTADEARVAWSAARCVGFDNMSLDLMYGLPGQVAEQWRENLDRALALGPEHLSLYALTVEEGTPLAGAIAKGDLPEPDDDMAAEMYLLAEEKLGAAGYVHYEISNWAKPGRECRHNLVYWRNGYYLGVGAGAHSHLGGHRFCNIAGPEQYVEVLEGKESETPVVASGGAADDCVRELRGAGLPVESAERTDEETAMAETMMLGLRLEEGVVAGEFRRRHGEDMRKVYAMQIEELVRQGLLEWEGEALRLTPRGRLLGNQVFCRFVG